MLHTKNTKHRNDLTKPINNFKIKTQNFLKSPKIPYIKI